jgi:hypothetical protein
MALSTQHGEDVILSLSSHDKVQFIHHFSQTKEHEPEPEQDQDQDQDQNSNSNNETILIDQILESMQEKLLEYHGFTWGEVIHHTNTDGYQAFAMLNISVNCTSTDVCSPLSLEIESPDNCASPQLAQFLLLMDMFTAHELLSLLSDSDEQCNFIDLINTHHDKPESYLATIGMS